VIEHNVPGVGHERQSSAERGCGIPAGPRRPLPSAEGVFAVRCTVAVPMRSLAPDLLSFVGFSLNDRKAYATVTVPYLGDSVNAESGRMKAESGKRNSDLRFRE
jgi:hypothetical protein